ncbi:MAG: CHAT domain-containing protein, partial [Acidimicrobiales bacterium]
RTILLAPEPDLTMAERELVDRLRTVVKEIDTTERAGANLETRRTELEAELRDARRRNAEASGAPVATPHLAPRASAYLFSKDGELCALHIIDGEPQAHVGGIDLDTLRRALSMLTTTLGVNAGGIAHGFDRVLDGTRTLLEPILEHIDGHESVVIIPEPTLPQIPWALLTDTAVLYSGSMAEWRLSELRVERPLNPMIVAGPRLEHADAEAARLARLMPGATVLSGDSATAENVLHSFAHAGMVHFATHGRFRSDNPMISSIELADGPLTFYDLLGTGSVPSRLVFSSCDVAQSSAQSPLGLAALLIDRGCKAFVASSGLANDEAAVDLMEHLHRNLGDGTTMAVALRRAQAELIDVEPSTAMFGTFGAG